MYFIFLVLSTHKYGAGTYTQNIVLCEIKRIIYQPIFPIINFESHEISIKYGEKEDKLVH